RHNADRLFAAHGQANGLARIGDEHHVILVLHGEGGYQRAVALVDGHRAVAFAAAPGDPVFVARRALAVAVFGDSDNKLLGGAHRGIAFLAELAAAIARFFHLVGRGLVMLALAFPAHGAAHLEIGRTLVGSRREVV